MMSTVKYLINCFRKIRIIKKIRKDYDAVMQGIAPRTLQLGFDELMYVFPEHEDYTAETICSFKIRGTNKIARMMVYKTTGDISNPNVLYTVWFKAIGIEGEKLYVNMSFNEFKESLLNSYMFNVKDVFSDAYKL